MQKSICIISQYYPDDNDMILSFVDQLVCQFADKGYKCDVITPVSVFERNHIMESRVRTTKNGNKISIWCPKYISVPHRKIHGYDSYHITMRNFFNAVYNVFQRRIKSCDVIYSHFLNPSGICACMLSNKTGIKAYVACGESSFDSQQFAIYMYREVLQNNLAGIISVSSENERILRSMNVWDNNQSIVVIPNGVDMNEFPVVDKGDLRRQFGIKNDDFVVAFLGHFIERKGINELLSAAKKSKGTWKCIFIGTGDIAVDYEGTIFSGPVNHSEIYRFLEAADVFVLPTKAEGCCNAIIEAMACSLPIVSSNLSFNDDILDDSFSVRINPNDVEQIYKATDSFRIFSEKRRVYGINARNAAAQLDIKVRAERILSYMFS